MSDKSVIQSLLETKKWRFLLAALKGFRNGVVYGVRIRAPHAVVMTFIFGNGTLLEKLLTIVNLTRTHATNLSRFVLSYKLCTGALEKVQNRRHQWHAFAAAFLIGYFVFGDYNGVNMQINLYLLSRILLGLARLAVEKYYNAEHNINLYLLSRILLGLARLAVQKGYIPEPPIPAFPWFAAAVWGLVLWLFEHHQHVLQNSLQNSMSYLYHDSNHWTTLKDFLWVNKL